MTLIDTPPAALFTELTARLAGEVITADDPNWDAARAAWNRAADQRPAAVAVPQSVDDVVTVVEFAAEHGFRISAQGTGHQALAVGDLAGTILIQTSALCGVDVDADARRVRAGAGVTWNAISAALAQHRLAALAGSAGDVGVVGYLLGGGYSWLGREHGLASTSVTAIELVTGDGVFRRADADSEPDLFWALRGGGGNFGVVTAVEFQVFPVPDVHAGFMLFPLEKAADLLTVFERTARDLDARATLCARILRLPPLPDLPDFLRGKNFAAIDGAINASDDEARALLEPFSALGPTMNTFGRMPTTALVQIHFDPPGPVPGIGDGIILDQLPPGAIDALVDAAGEDATTPLLLIDVRMLGGAFARPDARGGAVDHLPGGYLLNAIGIAPNEEAARAVEAAVAGLVASLEPWRAERDYSNFTESVARPEAFYADDTLARLRRVKGRVDPSDIIRGCHPLGEALRD